MGDELTKVEQIKQIRNQYGVSLHTAKKIFEKEELRHRISEIDLNDHEKVKSGINRKIKTFLGHGNAWGVHLPCTEDISRVQIPSAPVC